MGKHRHEDEFQSKEKKLKKMDSGGMMAISAKIQTKFALILENQPLVLCKKISSNYSGVTSSSKSRVKFVDSDHISKSTCKSTSPGSLCRTGNDSQATKKHLSKKVISKNSGSQLKISQSQKKSNNSSQVLKNKSSTYARVSSEGSSESEFQRMQSVYGEMSQKSKVNCTQDPERITPCFNSCCFNSTPQSKASEKRSFSQKSKSTPTPSLSQKPRTQLSQKIPERHTPKRPENRKPKMKESDDRIKSQSNVSLTQETKSTQNLKKLVPKKTSSQCTATGDKKSVVSSDFNFHKEKKNLSSTDSSSNGFSFRLRFNNSAPTTSQKVSELSQGNECIAAPKRMKFKRIQKQEYFPDLKVGNSNENQPKTSHPKASVNNHSQSQMLEASTFPKTNSPSRFPNEYKSLYNQENVSYNSPLVYQENEVRNSQSSGSIRNPNLQKRVQEFSYFPDTSCLSSENQHYVGNKLMKNSHDLKVLGNNALNNGAECCDKDRFRQFQVERNPPALSNVESNARIKLEPDAIANSTHENVHVDTGGLASESHLPYLPVFEHDATNNTIDFNGAYDLIQEIDIPNSASSQPFVTASQKVTIRNSETVPRDCIKVLTRPKLVLNERNEPQASTSSQFEKVAVINKQQFEQFRKNELSQSQESYDLSLINNFELPTSHQESDLLDGGILDENNDLENILEDGIVIDETFNNVGCIINENSNFRNTDNENILFHSHENVNLRVDTEDLNRAPALSDMVQLFDQSGGRSCVVPVTTNNNTFDDFFNNGTETLNFNNNNNNNLEQQNNNNTDNGTTQMEMSIYDFKEPCQNNVNVGINTQVNTQVNTLVNTLVNTQVNTQINTQVNTQINTQINTQVNTQANNQVSTQVNTPANAEDEKCNDDSDSGYRRKRKWFDEKKKSASEPIKKVKLKRRRWSIFNEGDDCTDASSEISSSCRSSVYDPDQSVCQPNVDLNDSIQSFVENVEDQEITTPIDNTGLQIRTQVVPQSEVENQIPKEAVQEKDTQVVTEPQPEPEQEESAIPARTKEIVKPRCRKKKKIKHRSKFSLRDYSSNSSSSSEDDCEKKESLLSDDEREKNDSLWKERMKRELSAVKSAVNDQENCVDAEKVLNDSTSNDDKEDDILSVCASPSLMDLTSSRCTTPIQEVRVVPSESSYNEGFCWDTFKGNSDAQCVYDLRSLIVEKKQAERRTHDSTRNEIEADTANNLFSAPVFPTNTVPIQAETASTSTATKTIAIKEQRPRSKYFVRICFSFLTHGWCAKKNMCCFSHVIPENLRVFEGETEASVYDIMCDSMNMHFKHYYYFNFKIALQKLNYQLAVQLYNEMNNRNLLNHEIIMETVLALKQKGRPYMEIIFNIIDPLPANSILVIPLLEDIINNTQLYEFWETVKWLFPKIGYYKPLMEQILRQCVFDAKNKNRMQEVYRLFIESNSCALVDLELWATFFKLLNTPIIENTMIQQGISSDIVFQNTGTAVQNADITFQNTGISVQSTGIALPNTVISVQNTGFALPNAGISIQNTGFALPNTGISIQNTGTAIPNTGTALPNTGTALPNTGTALPNTGISIQSTGIALPNTGISIQNTGIASPDGISCSPVPNLDQNLQNENLSTDEQNGTLSGVHYELLPIKDVPPAEYSRKDHNNVWKFYDQLESLRNGLKHGDYSHVVNIIKYYSSKTDRSLFTRHCHRVLAEEVKKSQIHAENIVRIAVQTGELRELREILTNLGTSLLIGLADQGLWVHAYELLKTLQNYELHEKNAGFILLAAEICLANHRLEKALTLIKQSDIIFTNLEKWKVKSNENDIGLRTSVITLLLESLCLENAEKAFFVFDLILGDQKPFYSPIDLSRIADKLMVSLIYENHIDTVINYCKRAMKFFLNFHESTYRIVIKALVPVDIDLARQFYQYSTYLGAYSIIQDKSVTSIIINTDWSEEEMYLVVSEYLRKMFRDVGFAASHIGTKQLSVSFVLETIPTHRQLYDSPCEGRNKSNIILNKSKAILKDILQKRFDPPITIVKKEQGKICKINGQSLVKYLQAGHFNT